MLWCATHADVFAVDPSAIGLDPADVAAFALEIEETRDAVLARAAAITAARTATDAANLKLAGLRDRAGALVRTIRTFAMNTDDENVYVRAGIPMPAPRRTAPPPAQPQALSAELVGTTGAIALRWKVTNPKGTQGTSYIVRRFVDLTGSQRGALEFLGVAGGKSFVDTSVPRGAVSVQYTVQGQRAGKAGLESQILSVQFGVVPARGAEIKGEKQPAVLKSAA